MSSFVRHLGTALVICVAAVACRDPVETGDDRGAVCPQSYEFGNFGCASLAIELVDAEDMPVGARFHTSVVPVDSVLRTQFLVAYNSFIGNFRSPGPTHRFGLTVTRVFVRGPIDRPDTVTVRILAYVLDNPNSHPRGALPILAADSVDRQVRVVPVGARPGVDTVVLRLRRR